MELTSDGVLVDAARALGPVIREHADEGERERRLSARVVEALAETGLLRLLVPRSLGGLEADLVTTAHVAEEVSRNDSAVGWTLFQNIAAWWCARLPDAGAEEIYADGPDTFIAGTFQPPLQAREAAGGYRVSGTARFASAIHIADWVLVQALIMDGDQPQTIDGQAQAIGAFLRTRDCRILDTWYSLGMRATDTNDIAADDVFVPVSRTYPLVPEFEPGTHYHGPLYRAPLMAAFATAWAPIGLAIAADAIAELRGLAERKTPTGTTSTLRELASTQAKVALADAILRSSRTFLYDILAESWQRTLAGQTASLAQRADLMLAAAHAMQSSVRVVELMHRAAGMAGLMTGSRLERHFRDAETLKQHICFSESRYETVGKVALGLPTDAGFERFLRF
jgi:alkylation response protein AidB-like acyl-CoA dehydrogenase